MRRILRFAVVALLLLALLVGVRFISMASSSRKSSAPGPVADGLAPCPDRPNCVGSRESEPDRAVAPIAWSGGAGGAGGPGEPAAALEAARRAIESMPRARVTRVDGEYLHAEFKSALFGFVDDLELLFRAEERGFEVRSASRVGYSDLGANRKRVEKLRAVLAAADRPAS